MKFTAPQLALLEKLNRADVVGEYDSDAAPAWRSPSWLSQQVETAVRTHCGDRNGGDEPMITEDQAAIIDFLASPSAHGGANVSGLIRMHPSPFLPVSAHTN